MTSSESYSDTHGIHVQCIHVMCIIQTCIPQFQLDWVCQLKVSIYHQERMNPKERTTAI